MEEVLGNIPVADLKVYIVWVPILPNDNKEAAERAAQVFDDPRMTHYWDPIATQAVVWNRRLDLPPGQLAWNVFVVLPRGGTWVNEPPEPYYWSHKLNIEQGIKYYPAALRNAVEEALSAPAPKKASADTAKTE